MSGPSDLLVDRVLVALLEGATWRSGQRIVARRAIRRIGSCVGLYSARYVWEIDPGAIPALERILVRTIEASATYLLPAKSSPPPRPHRITPASADDWLVDGRLEALVNVNAADAQTLADLPGLGPRSAPRLVRRRDSSGPIRDADSLRAAAGISRSALERLLDRVCFGPALAARAPTLDSSIGLGFTGLIRALRSGTLFVDGVRTRSETSCAAGLLRLIAERLEEERRWSPLYTPRARSLVESSRPLPDTQPGRSGILIGGAYRAALERLLATSTRRIWVGMFYFSESASDLLVPLLSDAVARGVDVRVVLGDDLDGDYHGARKVNATAGTALREAGVPVRRSAVDRTLHAKAVLVDDRVLVGSHNWTAGSFYRYRDISLLSTGRVVDQLVAVLDDLWRSCDPDPATRRFDVTGLELVPDTWDGPIDSRQFLDELDPLGEEAAAAVWGTDPATLQALRSVAAWLHAHRISEVAARLLVHAGLTEPAALDGATLERLQTALFENRPEALLHRRVPTALPAYLLQGE